MSVTVIQSSCYPYVLPSSPIARTTGAHHNSAISGANPPSRQSFQGFYKKKATQLQSAKANMTSAHLAKEMSAMRLPSHPHQPVWSDSQAEPGKWRLMLDLLAPPGISVNDGISTEACTPHMPSGKAGHRKRVQNVPIPVQVRHLLGMEWCEILLVDTVLPFGLRAAPKILWNGLQCHKACQREFTI